MGAIVVGIACGPDRGRRLDDWDDDDPSEDAGGAVDGGARDAGRADAGRADGGRLDGGADGGRVDAGPDGGPRDAGPADAGTMRTCQQGCSRREDCSPYELGPYRATHSACERGVCRWLGCFHDSECQEMGNFACRTNPGLSYSVCLTACTQGSDCQMDTGAYAGANFDCVEGGCRWLGCRNDVECSFSLNRIAVCRDVSGTKVCLQACEQASDCATTHPAYDADNYACVDGACVYTGCRTDAECGTGPSTFVCR